MLMYVLGFAIPFFVLSFFITRLGWIRKYSGLIMKIGAAYDCIRNFAVFRWNDVFTSCLARFSEISGFLIEWRDSDEAN